MLKDSAGSITNKIIVGDGGDYAPEIGGRANNPNIYARKGFFFSQ